MKKIFALVAAFAVIFTLTSCMVDPVTGNTCPGDTALTDVNHCHLTEVTPTNHKLVITASDTTIQNTLLHGCVEIADNVERVHIINSYIEARDTSGWTPCTKSGVTGAVVTASGHGPPSANSGFTVEIVDSNVHYFGSGMNTAGVAGSSWQIRGTDPLNPTPQGSSIQGGSSVTWCNTSWCSVQDSYITEKNDQLGGAFRFNGGGGAIDLRHSVFKPGTHSDSVAAVWLPALSATASEGGGLVINGSELDGTNSRSFYGPVYGTNSAIWDSHGGAGSITGNVMIDDTGNGPIGWNISSGPPTRVWGAGGAANVDKNSNPITTISPRCCPW